MSWIIDTLSDQVKIWQKVADMPAEGEIEEGYDFALRDCIRDISRIIKAAKDEANGPEIGPV